MSTPTNVPPILTPDEEGIYTCDICQMKVQVGCGGSKNFLQHRGSLGCLKAAKGSSRGNLTAKVSQTQPINSYFMKATQGRPSQVTGSEKSQGQNEVMSKAPPKPTPPLSAQHKPLCKPITEPRTKVRTSTSPDAGPDAQVLALLASVDHAAQELPSLIPEAKDVNDMVLIVFAGGPEDPSEAWEHLDRVLNRLLGYGIDIEDIAQRVRCGPLGIEGLTQYIRGFVVDYHITGVLLEGKLERLLKAIELLKQSVPIRLSNG
jgi:hypothetical protein